MVAEAQQIEHDDEHEHDSPTSESGLKNFGVWGARRVAGKTGTSVLAVSG